MTVLYFGGMNLSTTPIGDLARVGSTQFCVLLFFCFLCMGIFGFCFAGGEAGFFLLFFVFFCFLLVGKTSGKSENNRIFCHSLNWGFTKIYFLNLQMKSM